MMTRRILTGGLLAALALAVSWQTGEAGAKKSDGVVKVQVKPGADKQTVQLVLDIDKGWHLYANPVGNTDLIPAQTVVEVKAAGQKVKAQVNYPRGKVHKDKIVGDYHVYEDKVTIPVQLPANATRPVEISVRFQACDARRCLLPATVKQKVE